MCSLDKLDIFNFCGGFQRDTTLSYMEWMHSGSYIFLTSFTRITEGRTVTVIPCAFSIKLDWIIANISLSHC